MTPCHRSFEAATISKNSNFRTALLAGTALVGIGLFPSMPHSATISYTNGEDDTTDYILTEDSTFETEVGGSITATQSGGLDLSGFAATLTATAATDVLNFSGVISGTGSLTLNGSGTIILSGTNVFSGPTTLAGGTLQMDTTFGLGGGLTFMGSGSEVLAINNAITFFNSIDLQTSGTIATISGGIEVSSLIGSISGSGTTLTVNTIDADDILLFSGILSGSLSLVKTGSGALILNNVNTYSGGTTILSGTLSLNAPGTIGTGSLTIAGTASKLLALDGGLDITNDINLQASVTISTFTSSFQINTISGDIIGTGTNTLTFNMFSGLDITTVSGIISGTNTSLAKIGDGTLILSGTNTYSGSTTITEGTLLNDGTLTSNISIGVDGLFGGTGMTIGTLTVDGTLAPGLFLDTTTGTPTVTTTGTLTVTGTVTFNAGSTFLVGVDASGNSGLLDVIGAIDIQGGTLSVAPEEVNFGLQLTYTIASATGGITGAFDEVTSTLNFLAPSYEIVGNDIILTLDLIGLTPLAETSNQIAIAGQIDSLLQDNPSQDLLDVVAGVLEDFTSAPQSLDQMTGEGFGTLSTSALASTNLRLQAVNNHLNEARLCHNAHTIRGYRETCDIGGVTSVSLPSDGGPNSVEKAHWGNGIVWLQAYGGRATLSAGGSFNVIGLDLGYDRWVSSNILVGISAGFSRDQEKGFASLTSAEGEFLQFGAHTSITFSAFYFNGLATYSFGEYTTRRHIAFGDINRTATGTFDASTFTGYAELGMDAQNDTVTFQPFLSLQYTDISRDGFTETGADSINLTVASEGVTSTQAAVGLRMSTLWDGGSKVTLKPELRARFIYEFGNAADLRTSSVNIPGATASTITSVAGYDSAFLVGMGLDISDGADLHIVIDIDYLSSNEFDMWSGTGRIIWGF